MAIAGGTATDRRPFLSIVGNMKMAAASLSDF
jgi:hypothetical protein